MRENIDLRLAIACLYIAEVLSAFSSRAALYFVGIGDRIADKYLGDHE